MKQCVFTFLDDDKCSFLPVIKTCETTVQLKPAFLALSEAVLCVIAKIDLREENKTGKTTCFRYLNIV